MKAGYRRRLSSYKTSYRRLFSLRAGSCVWVCLETFRERNRTSDRRIPFSDALPLSHRDSTVSEVYNEFI